jgi:hypothetical protein
MLSGSCQHVFRAPAELGAGRKAAAVMPRRFKAIMRKTLAPDTCCGIRINKINIVLFGEVN